MIEDNVDKYSFYGWSIAKNKKITYTIIHTKFTIIPRRG